MIRTNRFKPLGLRRSLEEIAADLSHLAGLQLELLKRDAERSRRHALLMAAGAIAAAHLLTAAVLMASAAAAALLYEQTTLSWAGACGTVAGCLLLLTMALAAGVARCARQLHGQFEPSRAEFRANVQFLRELVGARSESAAPHEEFH